MHVLDTINEQVVVDLGETSIQSIWEGEWQRTKRRIQIQSVSYKQTMIT